MFNDTNSVIYIRFDALYNYLTVCKYPHNFTGNGASVSGDADDMSFWNDAEVVHCI